MDYIQFITMLVATIGLFAWNRSESRSDYRSVLSLMQAIQNEMKDFHGRMCSLEERGKK